MKASWTPVLNLPYFELIIPGIENNLIASLRRNADESYALLINSGTSIDRMEIVAPSLEEAQAKAVSLIRANIEKRLQILELLQLRLEALPDGAAL